MTADLRPGDEGYADAVFDDYVEDWEDQDDLSPTAVARSLATDRWIEVRENNLASDGRGPIAW